MKDNIKGYQLSNLWSYYSGNHSGVCLKLNKDKVLSYFENKFKLNTPLMDNVKYMDKINKAQYKVDYNTNNKLGILENKDALFFEKLKVWDREQEFRLICYSTNDYEYISLDGLLEEIIIGQKCKADNELIIKQNFPNLAISKMNYFVGDGNFEKIDINNFLWRFKSQV